MKHISRLYGLGKDVELRNLDKLSKASLVRVLNRKNASYNLLRSYYLDKQLENLFLLRRVRLLERRVSELHSIKRSVKVVNN